MYYDFYVYTRHIANFEKPFEITNKLVASVDRGLLGYNFNRYSKEGKDNRFQFTIRLNLSDVALKANVLGQLAEMQNQGIIEGYTDNNPLVSPPFSKYSINHHLAHETSTKCAFRFYEKKTQNTRRFNEWWNDSENFLNEFLPRWLKYCGFSFRQIQKVDVSPIACLEELANDCGAIVRQVDRNTITNFYDFKERLVHTLFNCISDLTIESRVEAFVALLQGYNNFTEMLQDLAYQFKQGQRNPSTTTAPLMDTVCLLFLS